MADNSEFGEFSSVSEGWNQQNHLTTSFTPEWLVYSDNQDWVSSVVPNNEQPSWNASFPELPKELSNLLSDEITSLGDSNTLATGIVDLSSDILNSGSGHDEFGDFECSSLDNPKVDMATDNPITGIAVPINAQNSSSITNKSELSWSTGGFSGRENMTVDEDDEFGDFEGPSIPKQLDTIQAPNTICSDLQDATEDEFGGFVSTTTEVKEKFTADDDFGSFEAAAPMPPLQAAPSTVSTANTSPVTPTPSFDTVAENCFHCDQTNLTQSTVDHQLYTLVEQSR